MSNVKEQLIENNIILKKTGKLNTRFKFILMKKPEFLQYIVEETCFLKYDASIKTRLQCILQDIVEQPTCKRCGDPCKMIMNGSKRNNTFSDYCSRQCGGLDTKNLNQGKDHQS